MGLPVMYAKTTIRSVERRGTMRRLFKHVRRTPAAKIEGEEVAWNITSNCPLGKTSDVATVTQALDDCDQTSTHPTASLQQNVPPWA
jgi:hypothetical protein